MSQKHTGIFLPFASDVRAPENTIVLGLLLTLIPKELKANGKSFARGSRPLGSSVVIHVDNEILGVRIFGR